MFAHAVGHEEFCVFGPAVEFFREAHFFFAQRLAVSGTGVVLVGRSVAYVAVNDDQSRTVFGVTEDLEGAVEHFEIIGIGNAGDIPAIADEAGGDVFAERPIGGAVEGDVVVVVHPAQVGKLQMPRQRSSFAADALHQVAVAAHGVDVVVEDFEIRAIEVGGKPVGGDSHADAISDALAQRPGRRFHAGSEVRFGMTWRAAAKLAEALQFFHGNSELVGHVAVMIQLANFSQVEHGV